MGMGNGAGCPKVAAGKAGRMWRRAVGALGASVVALVMGGPAPAKDFIGVEMDQAKLVKLPEGTATIVVGNPAIADVTMQRNGVVVITGRRAGRTNFIALDKGGSIISESSVAVSGAPEGLVLVQRGMDASTYSCAPNCLPSVAYGDENKFFTQAIEHGNARSKEARESASGARR